MADKIEVSKIANKNKWKVTLDRKKVGEIVYEDLVFQYIPKGSRVGGEKFDRLDSCIRSLGPNASEA